MPVVGPGYASDWTWICQWLDLDMPVVGPGYASGWTWICEWLDLILLVRGRGEMSKIMKRADVTVPPTV